MTPGAAPLLTVSRLTGLQFGQAGQIPGCIQVMGNGYTIDQLADFTATPGGSALQVPTGRTLALIGGDVILDSARLSTNAGQVALGGIAAGEVRLQVVMTQRTMLNLPITQPNYAAG